MPLPDIDTSYLAERFGQAATVAIDQGMTCVTLRGFPLPTGYVVAQSDLLLRLNPGYPDVPPDMWWFDPPVLRANGSAPQATDSRERYFDRTWQRWSRHFDQGQWRSGIDSLETFIALIKRELERETGTRS